MAGPLVPNSMSATTRHALLLDARHQVCLAHRSARCQRFVRTGMEPKVEFSANENKIPKCPVAGVAFLGLDRTSNRINYGESKMMRERECVRGKERKTEKQTRKINFREPFWGTSRTYFIESMIQREWEDLIKDEKVNLWKCSLVQPRKTGRVPMQGGRALY